MMLGTGRVSKLADPVDRSKELLLKIKMFRDVLSLATVGFLWGATNPFLRLGSKGIENIQSNSKVRKFFLEIWFLATRWQYVIPFILNQSGSVLYFLTLQNTSLSTAVPIANALSFVFTAISAHLLGETPATKNVFIGTVLVICGSIICLLNKLQSEV